MIARYSVTSSGPPWSVRLVSGYYRRAREAACRLRDRSPSRFPSWWRGETGDGSSLPGVPNTIRSVLTSSEYPLPSPQPWLQLQFAQHPVFDPVLVPPLAGVDLDAVGLHAEVDVNSAGETGLAGDAHFLALLHHVAGFDVDLAQMAVDGLQGVAMVHHDAVAVDAQIGRPHHAAVIGGIDRRVLRVGEIEPQVNLLVHLLAVVNVAANVGEIRLLFAIVDEGTVPQHFLFGLESQVRKLLVVLAPQLAVDVEETGEQVLTRRQRARGIDRVHQLLHQRIVDGEIAHAEFLGKELEPEMRRRFRARGVAGEDQRQGVGRQVPGIGEHGETLARVVPGQGEAAKTVPVDLYAGLVPGAAGRKRHQFHASLVDVVLQTVGSGARRGEHHVDIIGCGGGGGAEIVRDGFEDNLGFAFLQIRRLVLARVERDGLGRDMTVPEEAAGGRGLLEE